MTLLRLLVLPALYRLLHGDNKTAKLSRLTRA